ncbi:MAG: hypothetical protein RLZZ179_2448 [Verrucomicrobiota bacterium]|jgi:hypothetical protein
MTWWMDPLRAAGLVTEGPVAPLSMVPTLPLLRLASRKNFPPRYQSKLRNWPMRPIRASR